MFRAYALRGAKAGLVAGLAFGLFVALVGNPLIAAAEGGQSEANVESHDHGADGHAEEAGHHHDDAVAGESHDHAASAVSSSVTDLVGIGSAVLWGLLLGLGFGVAYFFLEPTLPESALGGRLVLAGAGFAIVSGAPWLVLPPSVPGAEVALSIDARLALYAGAMVAGALASSVALLAWERLRSHGTLAGVAGALAPFALLLVVASLLPTGVTATPPTGALGRTVAGVVVVGQIGLWTAIALGHAYFSAGTTRSDHGGFDALDEDGIAAGR